MLTKPIHQFLTHSTLCPPHNHQTPHRNTSITGRRYSTHRLAGRQIVKHDIATCPSLVDGTRPTDCPPVESSNTASHHHPSPVDGTRSARYRVSRVSDRPQNTTLPPSTRLDKLYCILSRFWLLRTNPPVILRAESQKIAV